MNDEIKSNTSRGADRGRFVRRLGLGLGVLLLAASLAVLGNVAWQLYGTGIATARDQHRLGHQFQAAVAGATTYPSARSAPSYSANHSSTGPSRDLPAAADVLPTSVTDASSVRPGALFAHLVVPVIGVNDYVIEGVGSSQLAEGPGHYPGTAATGSSGNEAIAGHRTTHTAPFYNLNDLVRGDLIYLTNLVGPSRTA